MAQGETFGWDEPRHRPAVFARGVLRAFGVGVVIFGAALVLGALLPGAARALFYLGLLGGIAAGAGMLHADRRRIAISDDGVCVAGFLGRLPARTLPLGRIGRAEIVAFAEPFVLPKGFVPERPAHERRAFPTQPTLLLWSAPFGGRTLLTLPLGPEIETRALLAFFRARNVAAGFADSDIEHRRRSAAMPLAVVLLVALLGTTYWSAQRAKAPPPVLSIPTITCVTMKPHAAFFARVRGLGDLRTLSLTGVGIASGSQIPVADVRVVRPGTSGEAALDGVVAFIAAGVKVKSVYALTVVNTSGGLSQVPFVAVPDRPQGKGC